MDTDDLTEIAWDVIVRAARVSDTLKAELGAMASRFQSEDEWLCAVRVHLEEIADDPDAYVDAWDLKHEEGVSADMIGSLAAKLSARVDKILVVPMNKRGAREW
ncbi:MAG: hypothetical protein GXY72_13700 [Deltaproteobacteria bacterium]|jgi:hypothetical protein|nr:hypothetical protein [Deltaproteobacteria bacterium]